jgi:lipopolysaccharide transport system ATP-binding protein
MRKAEIDRKLDEIIAFAELEKFLDTPVKRYSSGMYVRLAFAVAAHLEPEILLVDEVLAVGDLSFQSKCLNKMQDVAQVGRTVLFVSHNLGAIHRLCPRCILLNQGELIADEQTEQVVGIYVSRGMADRPEYVQPGDSQKPIHLRQVCLMTIEGQIASEFRYDQGFQIEIKYDVNQPIVDCSLWLAIRTAEETIVFGTADSDTNSSLYKRRELGYYSTRVELPPRWLNVGRYYLVVGIVQSGAISLERIEVSGFSVIGVGVPELNRPGILQPLINWTTTKVV